MSEKCVKMFDSEINITSHIRQLNVQDTHNVGLEPLRKSNKTGMVEPVRAISAEPRKESSGLPNVAFQFSVHEETGETMIRILDKESNKVIREIPSREDLERSALLRTYADRLFDMMA